MTEYNFRQSLHPDRWDIYLQTNAHEELVRCSMTWSSCLYLVDTWNRKLTESDSPLPHAVPESPIKNQPLDHFDSVPFVTVYPKALWDGTPILTQTKTHPKTMPSYTYSTLSEHLHTRIDKVQAHVESVDGHAKNLQAGLKALNDKTNRAIDDGVTSRVMQSKRIDKLEDRVNDAIQEANNGFSDIEHDFTKLRDRVTTVEAVGQAHAVRLDMHRVELDSRNTIQFRQAQVLDKQAEAIKGLEQQCDTLRKQVAYGDSRFDAQREANLKQAQDIKLLKDAAKPKPEPAKPPQFKVKPCCLPGVWFVERLKDGETMCTSTHPSYAQHICNLLNQA